MGSKVWGGILPHTVY